MSRLLRNCCVEIIYVLLDNLNTVKLCLSTTIYYDPPQVLLAENNLVFNAVFVKRKVECNFLGAGSCCFKCVNTKTGYTCIGNATVV